MNRGDVVLVDFPYTDGRPGKVRPALVVQNDRDNVRLLDTVIALITGNTSRSDEDTQHLVDPASNSGATSGLHGLSCVLCRHIYTIRQSLIIRRIGTLSDDDLAAVDSCLAVALSLNR
jgi:mRNA interferase MazF